MKNEILLTRRLNIETWRIRGTVAKAQDRKDMMLVLQYLDEFKTGTAKDISSHLLFDSNARLVVAQRLLELCRLYGLVGADRGGYQLTNSGQMALEEEKIFVPEDGCWELSVANDPLLPHSVIELCPFNEPNAVAEVIGKDAKNKLDSRKQNMKETPNWFRGFKAVELNPHAGGRCIRIDSVERKAERVKAKFSLSLEWNVGKNSIRIMERKKVTTQFTGPGLTIDDVWQNLLETDGRFKHWDKQNEKLAISFDEAGERSRSTMVSDFAFTKPFIRNGYQDSGVFDDVVIKGISVCAATPEDAGKWARWRLANSITGFASEAKYRQWVEKAQEPFNKHSIVLPERDEAARAMIGKKYTNESWFLLAASDWAL